jgi:hypothetical protein
MFQFPNNRQYWVCHQENQRLPDIVASRNISLDEEGVVRLSRRAVVVYDQDNDADYGATLAFLPFGSFSFGIVTDDEMFTASASFGQWSIAQDTSANVPSPTLDSDACGFNNTFVVSEDTDIHSSVSSTNTWTDQAVTLTTGKRHVCVDFKSKQWLAVSDGNTVKTINTSYAAQTTCTIPAGEEIVAMAYNAGYLGFATLNPLGDGMFYIWDGNATSANFSYYLGTNRAYWVLPFENTFMLLNGLGQLVYWTPSGMLPIGALPVYYTKGYINDYRNVPNFSFPRSAATEGDTILFAVSGNLEVPDEFGRDYIPSMPDGIWCYDKKGGLYHKYSYSGSKLIQNTISTANVNTTNNTFTCC